MVYLLAPDDKDEVTAQAWDGDAQQAFGDLVARVPTLVTAAREWMEGTKPDEAFREDLDSAQRDFANTRRRVTDLDTPHRFADAHDLYIASADLYVAHAEVYETALATPAGDTRAQLDLLARRVRELADRVFDRGRADLGLTREPTPDIDVNDPEEVPMWVEEGLAAGPPFDDQPAPRADTPPLRADTRPEQSRSAWERDVDKAKAPSMTALRTAIEQDDADALRDIARRFVAAAEYLRDRPDPRDGREESARLRLSWLVLSDAARAAQAQVSGVPEQLIKAAAMIAP